MLARVPNPFRPGFAEPPAFLAGRDEVLAAVDEAIAIAAVDHYSPRPLFLVGPRGVGKTVILNEIAARATAHHGWPQLHVEITRSEPLSPYIAFLATQVTALLRQSPAGRRFQVDQAVLRAQLPGVGAELRVSKDRAPEPFVGAAAEQALAELATAALERDSGFVLTVDEAQAAARSDFGGFAAILQRAAREQWPMVSAIAGLPTLREATHDTQPSLGYLERAIWYDLNVLHHDDTIAALKEPAARAGRPIDDQAADLLADATGGYPYAIQLYGQHAWRHSAGQPTINLAAAHAAIATGAAELDRGLYGARWSQTPEREREYLRAVAELLTAGRQATGRSVADRLGKTPRAVAVYRDRLLKKGTLVSDGTALSFAIPGMADYVRRQPPPQLPAPRPTSPAPDKPTAQAQALRASRARRQPPRPDRGR